MVFIQSIVDADTAAQLLLPFKTCVIKMLTKMNEIGWILREHAGIVVAVNSNVATLLTNLPPFKL